MPKIQRNLKQLNPDIRGKRKIATPALLSDSKGLCLKGQISTKLDKEIRFWCKGGEQTADSIAWFKQNIEFKLRRHGKIHLYVWLGTCDLTDKSKRTGLTSIRSKDDTTVNYLLEKYKELIDFTKRYSNIEVTILELPVYCVSKWNKTKVRADPSKFKEDDELLEGQVERLNQSIRQLYSHGRSPRFSLDLLRNRKVKKGKKSIYYHNFELYTDGVHPRSSLAQLWLKRLTTLIVKDCFTD